MLQALILPLHLVFPASKVKATQRNLCRPPSCPLVSWPLVPPCNPSLSAVRRCSAQPTLDLKAGKGMSGFYVVELKVRDCELDQFLVCVLNYVVSTKCLCSITQTGHDELMECIGFNSNEVAQSGEASGDKVVVKVRISGSSGARVYLDHPVFKLPYEEPILEAKARVWLDKNHHPVHLPSEFR